MREREWRLQTDPSWPADFIQRGLDGLEGLLMSGATDRISEGDRGHASKRELSTVTLDPLCEFDATSANVSSGALSGPPLDDCRRQDPACCCPSSCGSEGQQ
jgi:hypothetical protein